MPLDRIKQDWKDSKYKIDRDLSLIAHSDRFECIDENQSIKWNREEIIKRNEQADLKIQEYNEADENLLRQLKQDCCREMRQDYRFQQKQTEDIYDYLYDLFNVMIPEFFDKLDSLCQIISNITLSIQRAER